MATRAKGRNEPEPRPIIVKKIVEAPHGAHHGGAWKVAYADFVTAMMAFFLLLWLLGMTDEQKRKGIADYFTPTLVELKQNSAGSNGLLGGDSLIAADNYPHKAAQTGNRSIVIPKATTEALFRAIGSPQILWTPLGHYSSALYLPNIRQRTIEFIKGEKVEKLDFP